MWRWIPLILIAGCAPLQSGGPFRVAESMTRQGWRAYVRGDFEKAASSFRAAISADPDDADAHAGLGRTFLQNLRFQESWPHFARAVEIWKRHPQALEDYALSYHLSGDFKQAADRYEAIRNPVFEPLVRMMRSFEGTRPYRIEMKGDETRVPFEVVDPLPLVRVRLGGRGPYTFFIDTGAAEVFVDSKVAAELDLPSFGSIRGLFPGGERRAVSVIRIPSMKIGEARIEGVPGNSMDLEAVSKQFKRPVHGILGLQLLMRFNPTLDYDGGGLVLRRRGTSPADKGGEQFPFVVVGDHYVLVRGRINDASVLWFLDTGLEAPIAATVSTLVEAKVKLGSSKVVGQGEARPSFRTFVADEVAAGGMIAKKVSGLTDVFPAVLEKRFRIRIGGMLGHGFFRQGSLTLDFDRMRITYRHKD